MVNYQVVEHAGRRYVACISGDGRIESERDVLDLIAACGENQTHRLLLHAEALTDDFYHLRTGLAGAVLQKFADYRIKAAAVLTPERVNQGRFQEMVLEANRSNRLFHVFYQQAEAEAWLVAD